MPKVKEHGCLLVGAVAVLAIIVGLYASIRLRAYEAKANAATMPSTTAVDSP